MINVSSFITALKVSWLRRLIIYSNNDSFSHLSKLNYSKLYSLGDVYSAEMLKHIHNPFWKNILESWKTFLKSFKIGELEEIIFSPLWEISQISGNEHFIFKEWYDKGIRNIIDLVDENGRISDFRVLKETYNIKGTYLDYNRLLSKIPKTWKDIINVESDKCTKMKNDVQINCYIKFILKNKKGCRDIYDTLLPVNETNIPTKWQQERNDITIEEWKTYNKKLSHIKEVKLKDFQFKILNRILVTNRFLFKIKRIETDKCSYCNKESESIAHLLFDCEKVKEFWNMLKIWLYNNVNIDLQLDYKSIIFSACSQALEYFISVTAKYYIYKSKFNLKKLSIEGFQRYLKIKFSNEQYIAKINDKTEAFVKTWGNLYTFMSQFGL